MKSFINISIIFILSITLIGCKQDKTLSLKQVVFTAVENIDYFKYHDENELYGNIYFISNHKKQYVVFYQMDIIADQTKLSIDGKNINVFAITGAQKKATMFIV